MDNTIYIPECIKEKIGDCNYTLDDVGCSKSQVLCFEQVVLKIEKENRESDIEHKMLAWLQGKLPVPKLILSYKENGYNYLLMSRVGGEMACSNRYKENPELMIKVLVKSLKMIWSVDVSECPFTNNIEQKLKDAKYRIETGLIDLEQADDETFGPDGFENPMALYQYLVENKPEEELCFSHGDFCLPNLFADGEEIIGFIDLGRSGIADKWQDIALCVRSLQYNLGTDYYKELFLKELGIECNDEKVKYYCLLDELF